MRIRIFKVLIRITKSLHLPCRNCKFFYLQSHSTQHLFITSNCEHLCLVGRREGNPTESGDLHLAKDSGSDLVISARSSHQWGSWGLRHSLSLPKIIFFFCKYTASSHIKAGRHQSLLHRWCVCCFRANSSSALNEVAPFVHIQHK